MDSVKEFYNFSTILIFLAHVILASENNCVWTYRCCEFKEIDGVVKCERMCEAVIKCETTTKFDNEIESFNETSTDDDEQSQAYLYSFRRQMPVPMCRSGYKYVNGQCRRVLKK